MDTAYRAEVKRRRGKLDLLGKRENFVQALFRTEHQFAPGKINSIPAESDGPRIKAHVNDGEPVGGVSNLKKTGRTLRTLQSQREV